MSGLDRFKSSFKEEATELLNNLEASLLELENGTDNEVNIAKVFRAMHTIKGSASMFGYSHISHFTHEVENFLDEVRSGAISVSKNLINCTLQIRDHILHLLAFEEDIPSLELQTSENFIVQLRSIKDKTHAPKKEVSADILLPVHEKSHEKTDGCSFDEMTFRVRFEPKPDIMANGTRPLSLINELSILGESSIQVDASKLPELDKIDPEVCYLSWEVLITSACNIDAVKDVFVFAQDKAMIDISAIEAPHPQGDDEPPKIGEILISRKAVTSETIKTAVEKQPKLGEILKEAGVSEKDIKSALDEQKHIQKLKQKNVVDLGTANIKVASVKLDSLVDMVGELVTLQARLSQTAHDIKDSTLHHLAESLERLTSELRDNTMSMRMLPIGTTFTRFKRLVRDLGNELGKETELETSGGETELDKTVLEKLHDPLVHLIRNAVDHGVESVEERLRVNKTENAIVWLTAEHAGSTVLIKVTDDGKGLDVDAVQQKAIEKGLIGSGQVLTEQEAFDLIFLPGFSTAKTVSSVSGRGVGLDVVKKEIESLNGSIHIESEKGKGTSFVLEIPLTLAIIEGLLVEISQEQYVIPLSLVEECLEYHQKIGELKTVTIQNRGEVLPLLSLRNVLDIRKTEELDMQQIVVVNCQDRKLGLIVDRVIGDHQTVIKNLGRMYRDSMGMSGATIMGDGSVALILDVLGLISHFENNLYKKAGSYGN